MAEKTVGVGGLSYWTGIDGVFVFTTVAAPWIALTKFGSVSEPQAVLLHWSGARTLGETSNMILKIEILCAILAARNLSSTICVGVRLPSLLTIMRL